MGFRSSLKEGAKNLVSEFITNKQVDKGILDYDRRQEYSKYSTGATPEQTQQITQVMNQEGIIDPFLYTKYQAKEAETKAKALADPESDEYWNLKKQTEKDTFNKDLQGQVQQSFLTGDKRQKEVISKATEELMKDYSWTYDNLMDTYREYKDESLINEWNKVKPEYENLIKSSANKFGTLISKGLSYQDAYKQIIDEGKEQANKIVQIQSQLRRKGDWTGIKGAATAVGETANPLSVMKNIWKTASNTISAGMGLLGEGVEEGKQALGYYDTLEELSNLGVRKENESFKGVKQLKNRAFEVFDGMPQWLPELGAMFAGNAAFGALKMPEAITAGLKAMKLAPKTAEVSKRGRFLSENMEDFLLYDSIAQGSMGRPMTDEDIQTNWLLNIPINGMLSRFVPTQWATKTIPLQALNKNIVSNGVFSYISKNTDATTEDVAKAIYLDQAYRLGIDKEKAGDKILEGVGGDLDLMKYATDTFDVTQLGDTAQVQKYNEARDKLQSRQQDIKKGKMTLDDFTVLDLGDRIKATKGQNLGITGAEDATEKLMEQYKFNSTYIKENPFDKDTQEGIRNIHSKLVQSSMNNMLAQGAIDMSQYKSIVEAIPEGSIGRTILESKYSPKAKAEVQQLVSENKLGGEQARIDLNSAYDTIQQHFIQNIDNYNIKPGTNIGTFTYIGKDLTDGQPKFYNIFEGGKEFNQTEIVEQMKSYDRNISAKADTYNDILGGSAMKGAMKVGLDDTGKPLYDISNTFKGLSLKDNELINKKYVQGEMTRAFKPFGIVHNKQTGQFTITELGLQKLSTAVNDFEKQGWNISTINKTQMDAYKVIFINPYLQAASNFKIKGKDFTTYFEKLYKEQPDGSYMINLKYKPAKKAGGEVGGVFKVTKDFTKTEQSAAQISTEDAFKDWLTTQSTTDIKGLLNQYEDLGLENKIMSIAETIADSKDKAYMISGLKTIVGDILGDRQSNAYIKEAFKDIDSVEIYRTLVTRMLSKDTEFVDNYLDNIKTILDNKGMTATPLYEEMDRIREALGIFDERTGIKKPITEKQRVDLLVILNKQQQLFDERKFDIPDSFYTKYDTIKQEYNGKRFSELKQSDIEGFAKYYSIGILDKYKMNYNSAYKNLHKKVQLLLESFQTNYPDIKLGTRGMFKGIGVDTTTSTLYLDDIISFSALNNLLKIDDYQKYIFNHETGHIITYKGIKDNVKILGTRILDNIKALEKATPNIKYDEYIFYNKDTLKDSLDFLDILSDDKTNMIQRLIAIPANKSIPDIYKLIGQVEESVNEQQALYASYKYISDKELLSKIKSKLELINDKLDDNEIIDIRKAFAGEKDNKKLAQFMSSIDKSLKAETTPVENIVKEISSTTSEQVKPQFKNALNDLINGTTSKDSDNWIKVFNYLKDKVSSNEVVSATEVLNMASTNMTYAIGPYTEVIKSMFNNLGTVDIDTMYLGLETIAKWNKTDKLIPLDVYMGNKIIANILSSMNKYSNEVIEVINNKANIEIINQAIKGLENSKDKTVELLVDNIKEMGFDLLKELSKSDIEDIGGLINKYIHESLIGLKGGEKSIGNSIYLKLNDIYEFNGKSIVDGELLSEGVNADDIKRQIDIIADKVIDSYKLQYDVNLIGIDAPAPGLSYNSMLNTLGLKNIKDGQAILSEVPLNRDWLFNIYDGKYIKDIPTNISMRGIKQSFTDGLAKEIEFRFGNKSILISKSNYDSINAYNLLNEFMEGLVNGDKKVYELIIDGKSEGIQGSYRFFNTVPGKLILEKLNVESLGRKFLYSPLAEPNIGILDIDILQKVYDTLTLKKSWTSRQTSFMEWQELLKNNKNLPSEQLDRLIKQFMEDKAKLVDVDIITKEDIDYIKSKSIKGLKSGNKFSKQEGELYSKLNRYLYPKSQSPDKLFKEKFMEKILEGNITMYDGKGFSKSDAKIIAIRPKIDVVETISTPEKVDTVIDSQTYAKEWVSTLDPQGLRDIEMPNEFISKINYTDGEFFAKLQGKDGVKVDGIAIMEGNKIKFVPMKDIELEYVTVKTPTDYTKSMQLNIKEITDNEKLMKRFLTC